MPASAAPRVRIDPRILLLAIGTFAIGTDAFVITGILPDVARALDVSVAAAGQIVTGYSVTYALGSPLLAVASARWPRGAVVLAALAGFGVANALCAVATSYAVLMLARVAAGAAAALYTPTAYALAAAAAPPERRGAALAAVAIGLTGSTVLGVPLGVTVGTGLGWHATFWLITALAAAATIALAINPPPIARQEVAAAIGLRARLAPLTRGGTLLALAPGLIWSAASFTVYTYLAILLRDHGYGASSIVALLFAYGLGGLAGNQLGGRLSDRHGWAKPIALCLLLLVLDQLLLAVLADQAIAATLSLLLWSLLGWATWAPQQSRLIAREPGAENVVLALVNSTVYLASAAGAALGALLLPRIGSGLLPLAAAGLYALALVVFLAGERTPPRDHRR